MCVSPPDPSAQDGLPGLSLSRPLTSEAIGLGSKELRAGIRDADGADVTGEEEEGDAHSCL